MQYVDQNGHPITLGRQIGKGGEGTVYAIAGSPSIVAKIYNRPRSVEEAAKLAAMAGLATPNILKFAAWPVRTVRASNGGAIMGVVLPWIKDSREVHELYSPAHRKLTFPSADWRFLIRVARNCAAALSTLHAKSVVVGDVNQKNILVSKQATVSLLDCDSFQFTANGHLYRCHVGMPDYVPPELQDVHLPNVIRTCNHDNFGLANVIFHLLFMGRHPFAGRFGGVGDMPIEKAIKEYRFAYSTSATRHQMAPPPNSLALSAIPEQMGIMLERAFSKGSEAANARPSAQMWAQALEKLEGQLRQCEDDAGHFFYTALRSCPWCDIVRSGGPNFFIAVTIQTVIARSASFDLAAVLAQIQAVRRPDQVFTFAPRFSTSQLTPRPLPPQADDLRMMRHAAGIIAVVFGVLALPALIYPPFALCLLVICIFFGVFWGVVKAQSPLGRIKRERRTTYYQTVREMDRVRSQQSSIAKQYMQQFQNRYDSLRQAADGYNRLKQQRDSEMHVLGQRVQQRQLENHLRQCFVSSARISGIGPCRVQALESYGIETAFDVTERAVLAVPGFGDKMTSKLLAWRQQKEREFRFNPSQGVPQADIQAVEMKYAQLRSQCERVLLRGPQELLQVSTAAKHEVDRLDAVIARLEYDVAQHKTDLQVFDAIPWWQ